MLFARCQLGRLSYPNTERRKSSWPSTDSEKSWTILWNKSGALTSIVTVILSLIALWNKRSFVAVIKFCKDDPSTVIVVSRWAQNSGERQLAPTSRSSWACYQNILLLTAKTIYIQLYFVLIFRYFFLGQNKKIDFTRGWLEVGSWRGLAVGSCNATTHKCITE